MLWSKIIHNPALSRVLHNPQCASVEKAQMFENVSNIMRESGTEWEAEKENL